MAKGCQKHGVTNCIPCKTARGAKTVSHRRHQNFGRFNQPVKCNVCGKGTTWSESNGYSGLDLCRKCFDAATIENAHFDGYHAEDRDGFAADCPLCVAEKKTAKTEKENEMTKTKKTAKTAKKTTAKVTRRNPVAGFSEAIDAAVPPTVAPIEDHGPNARWPYGIMITDENGNVSYERLGTAKVRDNRLKVLAGTEHKVESVDYDPTVKTAEVKTTEKENDMTKTKTAKKLSARDLKSLAKKAAIEAAAKTPLADEKTPTVKVTRVAKVVKTAKGDKVKVVKVAKVAAEPIVKLLSKGVMYFPKSATESLRGMAYILVEVKGKKVTLTPTKSAKDSLEIRHNQIGVSKLLKDSGWDGTTQDLKIKTTGESFVVEVR